MEVPEVIVLLIDNLNKMELRLVLEKHTPPCYNAVNGYSTYVPKMKNSFFVLTLVLSNEFSSFLLFLKNGKITFIVLFLFYSSISHLCCSCSLKSHVLYVFAYRFFIVFSSVLLPVT